MNDLERLTSRELPGSGIISTISLIRVETRHEVFDSYDAEGIKLVYHCHFQSPEILDDEEDKWITIVSASAGKRTTTDVPQHTDITCVYGLVFKASGSPDADRHEFVSAAWHRFSVIFDLVSAQMGAELPPLPPQPNQVIELSDSEANA